jgi:hypothetical protein
MGGKKMRIRIEKEIKHIDLRVGRKFSSAVNESGVSEDRFTSPYTGLKRDTNKYSSNNTLC